MLNPTEHALSKLPSPPRPNMAGWSAALGGSRQLNSLVCSVGHEGSHRDSEFLLFLLSSPFAAWLGRIRILVDANPFDYFGLLKLWKSGTCASLGEGFHRSQVGTMSDV